jgi:hypothetical protein
MDASNNEAPKQPEPAKKECGWVKLYSPQGALVTIPVTEAPMDYAAMLANVAKMIDAGFAVTAPGLEAGETKETVGWVVRGSVQGKNGEVSDKLILYSDRDEMKYAILIAYLDSPEEVADFEYASGLKVNDLKVYIGTDKPQRGANKMQEPYFVKPAKKLSVVFAPNPKYNQADCDAAKAKNQPYKYSRNNFVRWGEQRPAAGKPDAAGGDKTPQATMKDTLARIQEWEDKNVQQNRCRKGDVWTYLANWARAERVVFAGVNLAGCHPGIWPDAAVPAVVAAIKNFKAPKGDGPTY